MKFAALGKAKKIGLALGLTVLLNVPVMSLVSAAPSIDYHVWSLQQPDGSTISSSQLVSGYTSKYFYTASDGGQAFMDPKTGTTTSGSSHPRSEMREQTTSGSNAAWSWTGTNTMANTAAVTLQGGGSSGSTTIGQIFNSTDSIPLVELEYEASPNSNGGNFKLLYEEAKGAGTYTDLSTKAALGSKFTYEMSLTGGVATVKINGSQVFSKKPSFSGKQFYFKTGNYDQTATSGSVSTTPYTIVELYSVNVVHN
ncbi:polysaccharide lyase family 7 protein [Paenibacillus sp. N3.4]|uniref:polysaccharide lyase family 7 protein n=1 Tax=Paenibacillus sp. N3.4 TaxID=2603222 RepID=UPI00164FBE23|nr:polysaccharide lyase family 7 protein [Paenibacillus sp. N3.4]